MSESPVSWIPGLDSWFQTSDEGAELRPQKALNTLVFLNPTNLWLHVHVLTSHMLMKVFFFLCHNNPSFP